MFLGSIADMHALLQACITEPPLGVIREQEEWPLRPKKARSMT